MGVYDPLVNVADRLIRAKGKTASLVRTAVVVADAAEDTHVATPTSYTVALIAFPPGRSAEYRLGTLEGRNILEFYIAGKGLAITPDKGDEVPWGGKTYKLVWVNVLNPNDDKVIYTLAYGEA